MSTIFDIPTISQLSTSYKNYAQSNSSLINPYSAYTDWDFKANAIASLVAGMYQDTTIKAQSIFPQYRTGTQVDISLANAGLIPRQPATFAMINATPNSAYVGSNGDSVINKSTGSTYKFFSYNSTTGITVFISLLPGIGHTEQTNTILTLVSSSENPPTFKVTDSVDGTPSETDSLCITRLINALSTPLAGARWTDYYQFCMEANYLPNGGGTVENTLTDAIVIPSVNTNPFNPNLTGVVQLGVYGLIGGQPNDYQLNQGLLNGTTFNKYNRAFSSQIIANNIQTSIYNQKLAGLNPTIGTCKTYTIPNNQTFNVSLSISVTLVPNISLSTIITTNSFNEYGEPITVSLTVSDLIKREARRAIVTQPLGAVVLNTNTPQETRSIPLASIEQQLDYALGASSTTGLYASLIVDRTVYNPQGTTLTRDPINVPLSGDLVDGNIQFTYDVEDYTKIGVSSV